MTDKQLYDEQWSISTHLKNSNSATYGYTPVYKLLHSNGLDKQRP